MMTRFPSFRDTFLERWANYLQKNRLYNSFAHLPERFPALKMGGRHHGTGFPVG
ncbi:MAG TPA: hypothetical protein VH088_00150 [Terriglobales bacterium]|nr:hypothetical protein [Terriglobales bacterium]